MAEFQNNCKTIWFFFKCDWNLFIYKTDMIKLFISRKFDISVDGNPFSAGERQPGSFVSWETEAHIGELILTVNLPTSQPVLTELVAAVIFHNVQHCDAPLSGLGDDCFRLIRLAEVVVFGLGTLVEPLPLIASR